MFQSDAQRRAVMAKLKGKRGRPRPILFKCNECGHGFRTVKAAEKAASRGCPGCGGLDIDVAYGEKGKSRWFRRAVEDKPPFSAGGWKKSEAAETRRLRLVRSCPKNWTAEHKYRRCGRAMQALANVTKDPAAKKAARADAEFFFTRLKELKARRKKK